MMYVRCSRCGRRRASGTQCDCIKKVRREYDTKYRNKEADRFYHSKRWIDTRNRVMDIYDSIDVFLFVTEHKIVIADVVHHIVPLSDDKTLALVESNLIPVSSSTHNMIHNAYDKDDETKKEMQEKLREVMQLYTQSSTQ